MEMSFLVPLTETERLDDWYTKLRKYHNGQAPIRSSDPVMSRAKGIVNGSSLIFQTLGS